MNTMKRSFLTLIIIALLLLSACTLADSDTAAPPAEAGQSATPAATSPSPANSQAVETTQPAAMDSPVPLADALESLEPRDVFQNFYGITQVPRPSGQMEQIRQYLVDFGEGLGLETLVDEAGNVLIRKPAAPGFENRAGVVLQAHMDMVPQIADGVAFDFHVDPIPAFVSGDYIVAEGTTLGADNGIGMAMIMAVLQSTTLEAGPLEALFTADEESDMSGANGLRGDLLQGEILINMDSEDEGVFTIGSAGGAHATIQFTYPEVDAPAGMVAYEIKVQGLKGGHSGLHINLGRGHATKLLVRLLKESAGRFGIRLASLTGGTAFNAIPTDATAIVILPEEQVEAFTVYIRDYEATVQSELSAVEPDLDIALAAVASPERVMDESVQVDVIDALYAHPQGVMRMSDVVPDLVETSTNMGVATLHNGQLEVVSCPRSSVDSALTDVNQMIGSVWELAGYPLAITDQYKGWKPDPESPVLGIMQAAYQELYGREPVISAVHAGLECGAIGGIYPEMDMISIGPTLNDVHSTDERLFIPSVGKVMALLTTVLQQIPGTQ